MVFPFLPNPGLKPETATTYEAGLNFNRRDLVTEGDSLHVKTAVFRNDIEDYIGLDVRLPGLFGGDPACPFLILRGAPYIPICYQYVNLAQVRIEGFEFESTYDAGTAFAGFNVTLLDGEDARPAIRCSPCRRRSSPAASASACSTAGPSWGGGAARVRRRRHHRAVRGGLYAGEPVRLLRGEREPAVRHARQQSLPTRPMPNYLNAASGASVFEPGFNAKFGATIRFGAT